MLNITYIDLQSIEEIVNSAVKLEQSMYRTGKDKKSAGWLLKQAHAMGIDLDDDMKFEIENQLGRSLDGNKEFKRKRDEKRKEKQEDMKMRMVKAQQDHKMKRISNSSFLTPEAAEYLNE